ASAGDMIIFPAMEGNPLLLVSELQKSDVPADLLQSFQTIVVNSPGELGAALSGGFKGWAAYCSRVKQQLKAESEE
ncbi:MAG: hypothetical protein ACRD36_14425, partial [Candidatus Acidiferrum sp.]